MIAARGIDATVEVLDALDAVAVDAIGAGGAAIVGVAALDAAELVAVTERPASLAVHILEAAHAGLEDRVTDALLAAVIILGAGDDALPAQRTDR